MSAAFEEFTRAASRSPPPSVRTHPGYSRFAVLGGAEDARLLAALCLAEGGTVTLFSAYGAELDPLRSASGIALRGDGPVGTYQVDREGASIRTTAKLDAAVRDSEVIFLTGPVHKQRTYAMVLAEHLHDGQVLVLAPGRSLGAVETAWMLRMGGCDADITIVERQGLPYWWTASGATLTLTEAVPAAAATLPRGRQDAIAALEPFMGPSVTMGSVLESGFADLSAAVELPVLMMGGAALAPGGPEIPMGGVALAENRTFANMIGAEQHQMIKTLAEERRRVAASFGVRNLPPVDDWIAQYSGATKGKGARPVPDRAQAQRMLRDGVIGSLTPLLSAADVAGLSAPATQSLVTLTGVVLGADVAAAGRRLETIGITAADIDDVRRSFDSILTKGH